MTPAVWVDAQELQLLANYGMFEAESEFIHPAKFISGVPRQD